jgi:hypothetical protein
VADYQRIQQLASAPGSPVEGATYYDTGGHVAKLWNGTAWEDYGSGGGGGGTVDTVVAGTDISVDDTDPANPVVSFDGTIPTTVEQLTLGGEAVAGAIPTSGAGPWILKSDGTSWAVEALPPVPTEIDGNLTLGGKPVAATPPTSGGPYFLGYDGTEWIADEPSIDGTTISNPSRSTGIAYQPNTARPTLVLATLFAESLSSTPSAVAMFIGATSSPTMQVATLDVTAFGSEIVELENTFSVLVPTAWYYAFVVTASGAAQGVANVFEQTL